MESRQSEPGRRLPLAARALAALLVLAALPAQAQDIAIVKSNLVVGGTNTYLPFNTNSYFTVTGRITSAFMSFTNSTEIYIQDTSSGIRVTSAGGSFQLETNSAVFQTGMQVVVVGRIGQTNGLRMIRPEFYAGNPYDSGNDFYISDTNLVPVSPEVTTISNLIANGENFEGKLIRVNGVFLSDTNAFPYKANTDLTVTDSTASITLFIDRDTAIDGQLPPTNAFDLIGIVGQFSTNAIPSNNYEIIARFYSDFIQTVGAELPLLPLATSATAVVNNQFRLDVVAQDRNAGDILTVTNTAAPAGTVFTFGDRNGVAAWTPGISDINTTNAFVFELSDGSTIVTATCKVVVRAASGGPGYAWLNEFHYDNIGTDSNEFIEVAGEAGIALTNYYIILYNGGNGTSYLSNNLAGVIDDEGNGYGAVTVILNPGSGLQNGSPDGIALGSKSNGVLQFISYEGTMIAANGPAAGIASIDVGVAEQDPVPDAGVSLQLQGNGTNYEAFTWAAPATATPGEINGCGQTIVGPANAQVVLSGLTLNPAIPATNQAFYIDVLGAANCSASNISLTAYYNFNGGSTSSVSMTYVGSNTYRSSSQVAGQTNGTIITYFAGATFTGPGTNSPTYTPMNISTIQVYVPVLAAIGNKSVTESNNLQFAVSATDQDASPVTLSVSNAPAGSTFSTTNLNGSFAWTNPAPVGVYTMTFYAADASGSDSETITITVLPTVGVVRIWINEIHYDDTGADISEGIEVAGTANVSLTNYTIVLYNFTGGATYDTITLTGAIDDEGCGYGAVWFPRAGIQNGPNDGIALVQSGSNVIQFLSYEGVMTGFNGAAAGMVSTDIGVTETGEFEGVSLQLQGTGNSYSNFSWHGPTNAFSTGTLNVAQNLCFVDPDDDDDLMPNTWENQYFGGNTNATTTDDSDNDGFDNLSEFISFTDPTNGASYFRVETIASATNSLVTVQSVTGRNYRIDFIGNLLDGTSWTNLQSGLPGTGGPLTITDTNADVIRNYRIGVQMQ